MNEFKKGDTVYDNRGYMYYYEVPLGYRGSDGHVVYPLLELEESLDGVPDEPIIVRHVFHEPPKEKKSVTHVLKEEELSKTLIELNEAKAKLKEAESLLESYNELKGKHEAMQRIDDFIEGRITHFVIIESGIPSVVEKDTMLYYNFFGSRDNVKHKLVSLYGDSDGNLAYALHKHFDGSGAIKEIFPFKSKEEAEAHCVEILKDGIARLVEVLENKEDARAYNANDLKKLCANLNSLTGEKFDQKVLDLLKEFDLKTIRENERKYLDSLYKLDEITSIIEESYSKGIIIGIIPNS